MKQIFQFDTSIFSSDGLEDHDATSSIHTQRVFDEIYKETKTSVESRSNPFIRLSEFEELLNIIYKNFHSVQSDFGIRYLTLQKGADDNERHGFFEALRRTTIDLQHKQILYQYHNIDDLVYFMAQYGAFIEPIIIKQNIKEKGEFILDEMFGFINLSSPSWFDGLSKDEIGILLLGLLKDERSLIFDENNNLIISPPSWCHKILIGNPISIHQSSYDVTKHLLTEYSEYFGVDAGLNKHKPNISHKVRGLTINPEYDGEVMLRCCNVQERRHRKQYFTLPKSLDADETRFLFPLESLICKHKGTTLFHTDFFGETGKNTISRPYIYGISDFRVSNISVPSNAKNLSLGGEVIGNSAYIDDMTQSSPNNKNVLRSYKEIDVGGLKLLDAHTFDGVYSRVLRFPDVENIRPLVEDCSKNLNTLTREKKDKSYNSLYKLSPNILAPIFNGSNFLSWRESERKTELTKYADKIIETGYIPSGEYAFDVVDFPKLKKLYRVGAKNPQKIDTTFIGLGVRELRLPSVEQFNLSKELSFLNSDYGNVDSNGIEKPRSFRSNLVSDIYGLAQLLIYRESGNSKISESELKSWATKNYVDIISDSYKSHVYMALVIIKSVVKFIRDKRKVSDNIDINDFDNIKISHVVKDDSIFRKDIITDKHNDSVASLIALFSGGISHSDITKIDERMPLFSYNYLLSSIFGLATYLVYRNCPSIKSYHNNENTNIDHNDMFRLITSTKKLFDETIKTFLSDSNYLMKFLLHENSKISEIDRFLTELDMLIRSIDEVDIKKMMIQNLMEKDPDKIDSISFGKKTSDIDRTRNVLMSFFLETKHTIDVDIFEFIKYINEKLFGSSKMFYNIPEKIILSKDCKVYSFHDEYISSVENIIRLFPSLKYLRDFDSIKSDIRKGRYEKIADILKTVRGNISIRGTSKVKHRLVHYDLLVVLIYNILGGSTKIDKQIEQIIEYV